MLERDPETGLVFLARVDPGNNPFWEDTKFGAIKKNYLKQIKEEREEELEQL